MEILSLRGFIGNDNGLKLKVSRYCNREYSNHGLETGNGFIYKQEWFYIENNQCTRKLEFDSQWRVQLYLSYNKNN